MSNSTNDVGDETPIYLQQESDQQQGTVAVQQMRQYQLHQCRICGISEGLRRCSRCQLAYYCSQEHQRLDWRSHKPGCRPIQQLLPQYQQQQQQPEEALEVVSSTAEPLLAPKTTMTDAQRPQQYAISQNQGIYQNSTIPAGITISPNTNTNARILGDAEEVVGGVATSRGGGVFENTTAGVRAELLSTNGVQRQYVTNTNARMSPIMNTLPFIQAQQQQQQQQTMPQQQQRLRQQQQTIPQQQQTLRQQQQAMPQQQQRLRQQQQTVPQQQQTLRQQQQTMPQHQQRLRQQQQTIPQQQQRLRQQQQETLRQQQQTLRQQQQETLRHQQQQYSPQSPHSPGSPLSPATTQQGSTSSSLSSPSSPIDIVDEQLLNETAVSQLFPDDSLTAVEVLAELDQDEVAQMLNDNIFADHISDFDFLVDVTTPTAGEEQQSAVVIGDASERDNNNTSGEYRLGEGMQLIRPAAARGIDSSILLVTTGTKFIVFSDRDGDEVTQEEVSAILDRELARGRKPGTKEVAILLRRSPNKNWDPVALEYSGVHLVRDLHFMGVAVLDCFLGHEIGLEILREVINLHTSGVFEDGRVVSSRGLKTDSNVRGDKTTWVDGGEPGCEAIGILTERVDYLVQTALQMEVHGRMSKYSIKQRTKAMVACYPGHGSRYQTHVDNPNHDGRCITAIYYLNLDWDVRRDGGLLRIYSQRGIANIEPNFDRILFFWSDRRNPHEVQPSNRTRYAITLWYLDDNERGPARMRWQLSCAQRMKTSAVPLVTTQQ